MDVSVVIPVLNEEENVKKVFDETNKVLSKTVKKYEIIFVDDGSWDKTYQHLSQINDKHLIVVRLRANFGQSAAMDAGFKTAKGKIIVTMDGDLQNDPHDIPVMIKRLAEGYDVISGWRHKRKDKLGKKLASRLAYFIRNRITKLNIHDSGCSLKVYKREAVEGLDLSGEMHRFIPALVSLKGFKIGELKVAHRPRIHGKTKYKFTRILKGLLDLLVVYFWQKWAKRPMHFFGGIGIIFIIIGTVVDTYLILERFLLSKSLSERPLFVLSNFVLIMGFQLFLSGILADIGMKNYYKVSKDMNYSIKSITRK